MPRFVQLNKTGCAWLRMVGKILIIDSVMTNRVILRVKLASAGYSACVAATGTEGLQLATQFAPDLIVLDMDLPDMTAPEVMAALRPDLRLRDCIVIMVSTKADTATRIAAFSAGCDAFLAKPIVEQSLLSRVRNFMRKDGQLKQLGMSADGATLLGFSDASAPYQPPARIILVAPKSDSTAILRRNLERYLHHAIDWLPAEMMQAASRNEIAETDLIAIMSDPANPTAALRMMSDLRSHQNTRDTAYCLLFSTEQENQDSDIAYDLGTDAVIEAHVGPEECALRLNRLVYRKRLADRTRAHIQSNLQLAMVDALTGLHNRRFCMAQLSNIVMDSALTGTSFAVMVIDIDHFKSVNDHWGHAAGDAVLIEVGKRLTQVLRQGDLLARIGGEEFVVALPNANLSEARTVAERLRSAIKDTHFDLPKNGATNMTISIGMSLAIADANITADAMTQLVLCAADEALMASKADGRNKVTLGRNAA